MNARRARNIIAARVSLTAPADEITWSGRIGDAVDAIAHDHRLVVGAFLHTGRHHRSDLNALRASATRLVRVIDEFDGLIADADEVRG